MHSPLLELEVETDYWIFCKQHENVHEAEEYLLELVLYEKNIPENIMLDIVKALRKVVLMSESQFIEIRDFLFDFFIDTSQAFLNYQKRCIWYDR